jgi:hypothetical protein
MNSNLSPRSRRTGGGALPRTPWLASERGDVPGWVLITLMTAGLVVALWALAGPSLGQVFNQAVTRVVSF